MKTSRFSFLIIKLLLIFGFYLSPVFSETILLKNGSNLRGKVKGQDSNALTIELDSGGVRNVAKNLILKVVYKNASEEELKRIRREEEAKLKVQLEMEKQKNADLEAKIKRLEKTISKNKSSDTRGTSKGVSKNRKKIGNSTTNQSSYLGYSAILPGWGQWQKGEKIKSSIFFTAVVATAWIYNSNLSQIKKSQSDIASKENLMLLIPDPNMDQLLYFQILNSRNDASRAANNAYKASLLLGVVYLINLADAYFSGTAANLKLGQSSQSIEAFEGISSNIYFSTYNSRREEVFTLQYTRGF